MLNITALTGICWMTVAATETVDELRARVDAQVVAGTLSRKKEKQRYTVYELEDVGGTVRYVGRTKEYNRRMEEHKKAPNGKIYKHKLRQGKRYDNLTYEACRGLEQSLMMYHHTRNKLGESGYNFVNGVGATNPKRELYHADMITYLENQIDNERLCLEEELRGVY